jgi:hypothetical protein
MPMIKIQFDDAKVEKTDIENLSNAIQKIVSEATGIEDVFVYGNSSEIKIKIAPIEIFVEMSASKIKDLESLTMDIKEKLSNWKNGNNFSHPINLSVIPMNWKVEVGI